MLNYITRTLEKQISNFWDDYSMDIISDSVENAYNRTINSIRVSKNKYLNNNGQVTFNLYHSGCWSIFLYYLSNELKSHTREADIIYYLNKILHGIDWYYQIELPNYFMVEHPIGSVLGRAKYGDFFFVYQGVTVGGNKSVYPRIGDHVIMYSNSKILGQSRIGNNVIISANAYIKDTDIPDNSIVFGSSPNLVIRNKPELVNATIKQLWL